VAVRRLPAAPRLPTGALCPHRPTTRPPGGDGTHLLALVLLVAEEPVRLWGEMGEGLGTSGERREPGVASSHADARRCHSRAG